MCGRFVSSNAPAALADFFGADQPETELEPRYNVAPTTDVYGVVASSHGLRSLEVYRWGLVPSWAKDLRMGSTMINARAETIAEKRSFAPSFRSRRLLVPMTGFYEWRSGDGPKSAKQPVYIHAADDSPLAVAGIWSAWRNPEAASGSAGEWLHTCAVITTAANGFISAVHDRMPVILTRSLWEEWLDPTNDDLDGLVSMLRPADDDLLVMHRVGTAVNRVQNRGEALIQAVDEPADAPTLVPIRHGTGGE
jgi:putative SOS response-associated peptidase YedK